MFFWQSSSRVFALHVGSEPKTNPHQWKPWPTASDQICDRYLSANESYLLVAREIGNGESDFDWVGFTANIRSTALKKNIKFPTPSLANTITPFRRTCVCCSCQLTYHRIKSITLIERRNPPGKVRNKIIQEETKKWREERGKTPTFSNLDKLKRVTRKEE